jgi:hypothetical protein
VCFVVSVVFRQNEHPINAGNTLDTLQEPEAVTVVTAAAALIPLLIPPRERPTALQGMAAMHLRRAQPCRRRLAAASRSAAVSHASRLVLASPHTPLAYHLPAGFCISYSALAPKAAPRPGRYLLTTRGTPTTSPPPFHTMHDHTTKAAGTLETNNVFTEKVGGVEQGRRNVRTMHRRPHPLRPNRLGRAGTLMLSSFLIASVSTGPTDTASIGPSPTPINIINRCGSEGAVDHEFLVTFKPAAANSNGRRLDTREDKLSFLQGWVDQYTVDQHDSEGTYSNGTTRRKLDANSTHIPISTHTSHFFTMTQFAVAVRASNEVRRAHSTRPLRAPGPPRCICTSLTALHTCARIRPSRAWPKTRPLTRLRLTASNARTCRCPMATTPSRATPARRTWTRPWPAG